MSVTNRVILRLLLSLVIAAAFGFLISEVSFRMLKGKNRLEPGRIELVIPAGTADRVASGEDSPDIPKEMQFITGDTLVVINRDSVSHQLGPVWVPAESSASLELNEPNRYTMTCSFAVDQVMGIDVQAPLTNQVRFQGVIAIGLPTGILLWLYSLVAVPVKQKTEPEG